MNPSGTYRNGYKKLMSEYTVILFKSCIHQFKLTIRRRLFALSTDQQAVARA